MRRFIFTSFLLHFRLECKDFLQGFFDKNVVTRKDTQTQVEKERKAPWIKMVPMIGSLGCPYTCKFCIDSEVPYQQLEFDVMKDDLTIVNWGKGNYSTWSHDTKPYSC